MRTHTIGEVLNRLKDEFDDITISKIRFLEAEGLINPDRTESGYRKFTEGDVDRLRYVLRAQRDRYLPLKVIRDELDRRDAGLPVDDGSGPAAVPADAPATAGADDDVAGPAGHGAEPSVLAAAGDTDVELSLTELADASGLDTSQLRSLMDHGLLEGPDRFNGDDLRAARAAGELLDAGLEARHLRMYRQFADRELALYQQLVTPLLRQRNPGSRKAAEEQVEELAASGARLHRILLGRQLRALLRS